jgi:predicted nucleic acid-binding protein
MIVYADTSALVKYYVKETGTKEVALLIDRAEMVGFVSLTYAEMASAISKAARMKWISEIDGRAVWQDFLSRWPSYTKLSVNTPLLDRAARLTWEHGLRAYDAVHLAAALDWRDALAEPITLATYDKELWMAGQKTGLSVWPNEMI